MTEILRPTHLTCNASAAFEVTWKNEMIAVYETSVNHEALMTYTPTSSFDVNAVALSIGYGYDGTWRFNDVQGKNE